MQNKMKITFKIYVNKQIQTNTNTCYLLLSQTAMCFNTGGKGWQFYSVCVHLQYSTLAKRFLRASLALCDFTFSLGSRFTPRWDTPLPAELNAIRSCADSKISMCSQRKPWEPDRTGDAVWRRQIWVGPWNQVHDGRNRLQSRQAVGAGLQGKIWIGADLWAWSWTCDVTPMLT